MLDFYNLQKYRENNRIEAKKALGGLPKSIWETYSAFANTHGGFILLGVEELADKALHALDLPDPERLIREFYQLLNDPATVSVNILSARDVFIQEVEGKKIVVIHVPRAERSCKPVYVAGKQAYRRNGEGDYRCSQEECLSMLRDAAAQTPDMALLQGMDASVFHLPTIRSYRQRLTQPGKSWEALEDREFLLQLGAAGLGEDGQLHPTAAGLLLFGKEPDIRRAFPGFRLDYLQLDGKGAPEEMIFSASGDWSGNVYDFFFRVYGALLRKLPTASEEVQQALQEALANCLVHADYHADQGVSVVKTPDSIVLSNPGSFRIAPDAARSGGVSDPRNSLLLKLLHLIDIGRRAGSGIPRIIKAWQQQGWAMPEVREQVAPERTTLLLTFQPTPGGNTRPGDPDAQAIQNEIIAYLTDQVSATGETLAQLLGMEVSQAELLLEGLLAEGTLIAEGSAATRSYRLKF